MVPVKKQNLTSIHPCLKALRNFSKSPQSLPPKIGETIVWNIFCNSNIFWVIRAYCLIWLTLYIYFANHLRILLQVLYMGNHLTHIGRTMAKLNLTLAHMRQYYRLMDYKEPSPDINSWARPQCQPPGKKLWYNINRRWQHQNFL